MKFAKKNDIIIITVILIISAAAWFSYKSAFLNKSAIAEIYYNSELVETVDLSAGADRTFSVPQNKNVIFHVYKDGYICFEDSDCPDKVCIHAGKLNTPGEFAACLPNSIVLKIVSGNHGNNNPDIAVG